VLAAGTNAALAGVTLHFAPTLLGATAGSSAAPQVVSLVP